MCGGFTCSKNALISLNILYILVSFILIGVAVYGKAASLVTNLPIVGGILACGVILFLISLLGLVGAVKHHQVTLFFPMVAGSARRRNVMLKLIVPLHKVVNLYVAYISFYMHYMVILFLLFLIQFSVACACLGVNMEQQEQLAEQGWGRMDNNTKTEVQLAFTCCGFDKKITGDHRTMDHPSCEAIELKCCPNPDKDCHCPACMSKMQSTINYAFKLCGWIGLFFSFTEFLGVWLTVRYRNQKDPRANPSAFL